jgi:ADP-ribose pyrophosphatase YjhB (NUDIX family)
MATYKSVAESRSPKAHSFSHSKKYCNNCGQLGHIYKDCSRPVTSFGIICYAMRSRAHYSHDDSAPPPLPTEMRTLTPYNALGHPGFVAAADARFRFLMIRRKDSLGFVDFMRGRYNLHNRQHIRNLIDEMTMGEKRRLRTLPFHELWRDLWGRSWFSKFKQEEAASSSKLAALKRGVYNDRTLYSLDTLIDESETSWEEPEWEFPKGRRNNSEYDVTAALREFSEETGVHKQCVALARNLDPFVENYTGSNFKAYKNVYYLGCYKGDAFDCDDSCEGGDGDRSECGSDSGGGGGGGGGSRGKWARAGARRGVDWFAGTPQQEEVSKIRWCTLSECVQRIRPYCHKKIEIAAAVSLLLLQCDMVGATI